MLQSSCQLIQSIPQRTINELKVSQRGLTQEGKDKKKAEKMAALMGNFESVRLIRLL